MADRDMYRADQNNWERMRRGGPDAADRMDADRFDWSASDEGRSFGREQSQTGYGQYSRGEMGRAGRDYGARDYGPRDYGGQGAYGQGRSAGGYGYGAQAQAEGPERGRYAERLGPRDDRTPADYDRGGQGGYSAASAMEQAAYARWGYEPGLRSGPPGLQEDRSPREFYGQSGARPESRRRHEHDHDPHYSHWRASQLESHDRDYAHWRDQQAKRYDEDYGAWRNEKHQAFSKDFESWRSNRDKERQQPTDLTVSPPEVENVSDGKPTSFDRNKN